MSSDAAPTADLQHIKFNVAMSCGGCSGAVTRALSKVEGLFTFLFPLFPLPSSPVPHTPYTTFFYTSRTGISACKDSLLTIHAAGLDKFDVSLENQTADVWAPKDKVDSKAVIQKVLKTGKTVSRVTINGESVDLDPIRAEM